MNIQFRKDFKTLIKIIEQLTYFSFLNITTNKEYYIKFLNLSTNENIFRNS